MASSVNNEPGNGGTVGLDRRDTARRAEVVRAVLEEIVHTAVPVITVDTLQDSLQVSPEAATRIVQRLVSAGLLVETQDGTWVKVSP
jgi:Mn-dependent DtxR family transcriptional regulator